jgi:hypothetical protein
VKNCGKSQIKVCESRTVPVKKSNYCWSSLLRNQLFSIRTNSAQKFVIVQQHDVIFSFLETSTLFLLNELLPITITLKKNPKKLNIFFLTFLKCFNEKTQKSSWRVFLSKIYFAQFNGICWCLFIDYVKTYNNNARSINKTLVEARNSMKYDVD